MLSHECTNMFCMPRLSAHYGGNARICFVCLDCDYLCRKCTNVIYQATTCFDFRECGFLSHSLSRFSGNARITINAELRSSILEKLRKL